MFVKAKQSGELLTKKGAVDKDGYPMLWTPEGVVASREKIATAYRQRERLNIEGLMIVSGAGNIVRGDTLRRQGIAKGHEDVLGRLAIIQNTIVLADAIKSAGIPTKVFLAGTMGFTDATYGTIEPYDSEAEREAYEEGSWVLVGGGSGEDNKTTDNAVLYYAARHKEAWPADEVVVLKGTKHDGVYNEDPETNAQAKRYVVIPAQMMIDDYERLKAVDRSCLDTIIETGISMRVYQDGTHDLEAALRGNGSGVGTLIVPELCEPILA